MAKHSFQQQLILIFLMMIFVNTTGYASHSSALLNGFYLPTATEINNFHLTDSQGHKLDKQHLKGQWTLMFFGFTNCAMICPKTLSALNKMYQDLETSLPKNNLPKIVFISIDPERDTPARIQSYLHAFNSHFIGAAYQADTALLMKQLNIAVARIKASDEGNDHYTLDHTAQIFIFNPAGKLQAYLDYPHEAERLIADYKTILGIHSAAK